MNKTPVSTLTVDRIPHWVGRALKWVQISEYYWKDADGNTVIDGVRYEPHINGGQCSDLVKQFYIHSYPIDSDEWEASIANGEDLFYGYGPSWETACCRAVIASVFGEYVIEEIAEQQEL